MHIVEKTLAEFPDHILNDYVPIQSVSRFFRYIMPMLAPRATGYVKYSRISDFKFTEEALGNEDAIM